jgi:hypothetical protein
VIEVFLVTTFLLTLLIFVSPKKKKKKEKVHIYPSNCHSIVNVLCKLSIVSMSSPNYQKMSMSPQKDKNCYKIFSIRKNVFINLKKKKLILIFLFLVSCFLFNFLFFVQLFVILDFF